MSTWSGMHDDVLQPPEIALDYPGVLSMIVKDPEQLSAPCSSRQGKHENAEIGKFLTVCAGVLDNGPPGSRACAGLAANQLGIDARVFVVKIGGRFKAFVNPVILGRFGAKYTAYEGCFSFPGEIKTAIRYPEIMIKADGLLAPRKLRGSEAQAFQHEMDHLDGVLV